jgi:hypothetical protein
LIGGCCSCSYSRFTVITFFVNNSAKKEITYRLKIGYLTGGMAADVIAESGSPEPIGPIAGVLYLLF